MRTGLTLLLVVALAGCEGCGADDGTATSPDPEPGAQFGSEDEASDPPVVPAGPAPTLRVYGEPEAGTVNIGVENRGDEPASLAAPVIVERQSGGSWAEVDGIAALTLRFDCTTEAPECTTIVPGAALHPPAWLGTLGDAQCECTRCGRAPAGTYRFVVRSCDGGHRVEGEPFELTEE